jgi:transcriptional regulator with GAF, ATPase, and Fis domain
MALLVLFEGTSQEQSFALFKNLSTIGSDPESDIRVVGLPAMAAHVRHEGSVYTLVSADGKDLWLSGRMVRKQPLSDGDEIRMHGASLRFRLHDQPQRLPASSPELDAYRRLVHFSRRLGAATSLTELLASLMDEAIGLTKADKGFLVLLDHGVPRVRMARNLQGQSLDAAVAELSDSIVRSVLEKGEPVVIRDALSSTQFQSSASVMSLKISSVMCVPLQVSGAAFGALYVGNNSAAAMFDEQSLEVLGLFAAQAALLVQNALHVSELNAEKLGLQSELERSRYGDLVGSCDGMREVFRKIEKVAKADVSVLVTGETGTGKELIARELHRRSGRAKGPLVVVNCGAIPETLMESELFGHVKGAFTGAVATRPGRFQLASGGTLFLDEIGEMPMHLQVKLLRALQEKQVTKVGDARAEGVDIRVVAATHRNLDAMIRDGTFREDLYYRLNVVQIQLPPLRDRGDDIIVLASYLLKKYALEYTKTGMGFSAKATTALRRYPWPGNVRQLENRLKRAIVLADGPQLTPEDLDLQAEDLEEIVTLTEATERFRRRYINEALERNAGNRTKTARELGVDPRTVFRHLEAERGDEGSSDG